MVGLVLTTFGTDFLTQIKQLSRVRCLHMSNECAKMLVVALGQMLQARVLVAANHKRQGHESQEKEDRLGSDENESCFDSDVSGTWSLHLLQFECSRCRSRGIFSDWRVEAE